MKIVVVDSTRSARVYDHFFCKGLADVGCEVALYGRPKRKAEEISTNIYSDRKFFFRKGESLRQKGFPKWIYRAFKGVEYMFNTISFIKEMKRMRPDVIHFQWMLIPLINKWAINCLRRFTKVVCTVHDTKKYPGGQIPRIMTWGRIAAWNSCDLVLVHTTHGLKRLVDEGVSAEKIKIFPHGKLDHSIPEHLEKFMPPRLPYKVILFFGTLWKFKEIDILIKAYAAMDHSVRAQTQLWIVGKPIKLAISPLKKLARDLGVESQIIWDLRYIPDHEVQALQQKADIFVFPFHALDISRAMMSSLEFGKPIVATNSGGFSDYIKVGVHGCLFPRGDHLSLAAALEKIISNPELAKRMGEEVLKLSASIPDWGKIAERAVELYQEVISRKD